MILLILAGALSGAWIGKRVAIQTDRDRMLAFANQLLKRGEAVFSEADNVLAEVGRSDLPFCSNQEITFLRDVLFRSKYLKDIGRIENRTFHCSAVFGRASKPKALPKPDAETPGGKLIHSSVSLAISRSRAPIIGTSNANVVLDPTAFDNFSDPAYSFGIMLEPGNNQKLVGMFGALAQGPLQHSLVEGPGREEDIVYRNLCSGRICASVQAQLPSLETAAYPIIAITAAFGGALGGAAGLISLLVHRKGLSIRARLIQALNTNGLGVEYQPITDVKTGNIVGAEALVRWNQDGEFIPTDAFILIAENEGVIGRITLYVIERIVIEMGECLRQNLDFRINVNISASDLYDPDFGALVETRLKKGAVRTSQLGLEITERSSANSSKAVEAIQKLRSRGHRIYIDDFGTGYSSLAYLGELNVDGIKIDKSFTHTIGTGAAAVSIVPQIIDMALAHNLGIVVEGIETAAQRDYFASLKTRIEGQGWLFGRPVGAAVMARLLSDRD
ncbi:MAG: EAL domain-containing protein [Phyllobacterium sp.]